MSDFKIVLVAQAVQSFCDGGVVNFLARCRINVNILVRNNDKFTK
jgi:hypothetical protein